MSDELQKLVTTGNLQRTSNFFKESLKNKVEMCEEKNVYLAPDGSDENGDGTYDNPYATIPYALSSIGDFLTGVVCLVLKPGVYNYIIQDETYMVYLAKHSYYLAINSEYKSNPATLNITDDHSLTENLQGGVFSVCCGELTVSDLTINYTGKSTKSNAFIFRAAYGGICCVTGCKLNISKFNTSAFSAAYGGSLYTRGTCYVKFIGKDDESNSNYGSHVRENGILSLYDVRVSAEEGTARTKYGNYVENCGIIQTRQNNIWNAYVSEDYNSYGIITHGS